MAEDPVQVGSSAYTTLLENERVRLLEVRMAPGDSFAMHGHPDCVVYNTQSIMMNVDVGLAA